MAKPVKQRGHWRIRWADEAGRRRSAIYDDYKVAQHELRLRQTEAEEVARGVRTACVPDKTFGDLADYWLQKRAPLKHNGKNDASIIRCHLRPAFGHLKLLQLSTAHVDEFTLSRRHLHDKTTANILTLMVTMMNVGTDLGWLPRAPRIKKPTVRPFDEDYRFLRTKDEVRRFLASAAEESELVHALYATALFTGMRHGELAGLRWSDIGVPFGSE